MPEMIGSVDPRRRPMLRVPVQGYDDLLSIIDTAFTGELLVDEDIARTWGVIVLDVEAEIELGDGTRRVVRQGLLTVSWLGVDRDVTVQVVARPGTQHHRTQRDGEPVGIVGTELLAPGFLTVDFSEGLVTVRNEHRSTHTHPASTT